MKRSVSIFEDNELRLPHVELWDLLGDVIAWVKDCDGRFLWVNEAFAKQARIPLAEIVGKRDADCFPGELASVYMQDDVQVVADGTPIKNKPELVITLEGGVEWRQTSKFPVRNAKGRRVGTMGMSRKMAAGIPLPTEHAILGRIIEWAQKNVARGVKVSDMAREAHVSLSTLERYIGAHLGVSPLELLRKIKMDRACRLLSESSLNVSEIASQCGYESVSSFARAFRTREGMSPGAYRSASAGGGSALRFTHDMTLG